MPEAKKASDILICTKCGDRVLAVVVKEKGWKECPLCGGKYVEEKTPPIVT